MIPGPLIFLDKDGTLIEDLPYNVDPARIRLAPGARPSLARLGRIGARVVIVTNQSGVARGYFDPADLVPVRDHLARVLEAAGVCLLGFFACPHLPRPEGVNRFAVDCDCRKPAPGLVLRAAEQLALDPTAAWMIGDTWMDVACGQRAGCRTILVGPDGLGDDAPPDVLPDHAVRDLDAAARIIQDAWVQRGPERPEVRAGQRGPTTDATLLEAAR
jgi:histidinol-phosphate phosphatase family protein